MQLLTFLLGNVKYGIPIQDVQSIEQRMNVVGIPNSLPYIKGIMNLHGNIIPVYSLAVKFGYSDQQIENIVVTDVNGMLVGFEVCRVQAILEIKENKVIPMPEVITYSQHYMPDVANHNKDLIVMLDVKELITEEEQRDIKKLIENAEA